MKADASSRKPAKVASIDLDDPDDVPTRKSSAQISTATVNRELAYALAERLINEAKNSRQGISHGLALRAIARRCRHAAECFSLWYEPGVITTPEQREQDRKNWDATRKAAAAMGVE